MKTTSNPSEERPVVVEEVPVEQIIPDDRNFNVGSPAGQSLIEKSFAQFGAGRSILIDRNYRNIAGNKSLEGFKAAGGKKVLIVDADKDTLVAVRRPDIDLDSKEGREMALADNQTQAINYIPDEDVLRVVAEELDIETGEWGIPLDEEVGPPKLKEEELRPFVKTHILLSFPPHLLLQLEPYLLAIKNIEGVEYEQGSN